MVTKLVGFFPYEVRVVMIFVAARKIKHGDLYLLTYQHPHGCAWWEFDISVRA